MGLQDRPIGVFDSGIGGLTVLKQIQKVLPNENLVYFGDTARVPYGTKSKKTIIRFSIENALFLLKFNIKLLVVACNSSSSYSLPSLKRNFKLPVIGVIKPAVEASVGMTVNKRIGIIGTAATMRSMQYPRQIKKINSKLIVKQKACPLFVPLAEEGWINHPITGSIAKEYLTELKKHRIDTLILGCTHYPLLYKTIKRAAGNSVTLIDSAYYTALKIKKALQKQKIDTKRKKKGICKYFVSDEPERFSRVGKLFLEKSPKGIKMVVTDA